MLIGRTHGAEDLDLVSEKMCDRGGMCIGTTLDLGRAGVSGLVKAAPLTRTQRSPEECPALSSPPSPSSVSGKAATESWERGREEVRPH